MITLDRDTLTDPVRACAYEWLLADGLGGYAASTPLGAHTRREHGLLVVATHPPLGRLTLISQIEETLWLGADRYDLSTHFYDGAIHPEGHRWATSFSLDPLPTLQWDLPAGRLTRTIARVQGTPGLVVQYHFDGRGLAILELRPLLAYREPTGLQHENGFVRTDVERDGDVVVVKPYDACPALGFKLRDAAWHSDGLWYRGFAYPIDRDAGRDFREDLFSPGHFALPLKTGTTVALNCWALGNAVAPPPAEAVADERRRLRELGSEIDGLTGLLRRAADAFIVRRGENGRLIVSGYPAAPAGLRDAALALPGLCLATGRTRDARAVLTELARSTRAGLVGERLDEWSGESQRGSIAATLLWVLAVQRVVEATGDLGFLKLRLKDVLFAALDGLVRGRVPGARLEPDGLLAVSQPERFGPESQAEAPARLVIEIQALWTNALLTGADIATRLGDEARAALWSTRAAHAREAVQNRFWLDEQGYLADALTPAGPDTTLRPWQLFAVGLPHCLLPADRSLRLLAAVERELLTPVGLRGAPAGAADVRDAAAWPFVMGLYFDALIRLQGEEGKRRAREWLKAFTPCLDAAGLSQVSERFEDGDPLRPGGQPAHAAAVAELLRICLRVAGKPPAARPTISPRP